MSKSPALPTAPVATDEPPPVMSFMLVVLVLVTFWSVIAFIAGAAFVLLFLK